MLGGLRVVDGEQRGVASVELFGCEGAASDSIRLKDFPVNNYLQAGRSEQHLHSHNLFAKIVFGFHFCTLSFNLCKKKIYVPFVSFFHSCKHNFWVIFRKSSPLENMFVQPFPLLIAGT